MDLNLVLGYWSGEGKRTYHHTAPINPLYGLHEALVMLAEEGIENAWARHRAQHEALKAGLEKLGLEFIVPGGAPAPIELGDLSRRGGRCRRRARLLNEFNLEIGAGLGALAGKIWRIGLMGASARQWTRMWITGA
jgi:alanine-glyoxylate transaminase/serine-glyoxylate transaminase/serine-pyruvate transaminase